MANEMPANASHDSAMPGGAASEPPRPFRFLGVANAVRRLLGVADEDARHASVDGSPLERAGNERSVIAPHLETVPVGRLTLMGLSEIREELGGRWEALSEKVHAVAQQVVARHLMRGDVFEPHGEDGYVLLFASLTVADAEFKCRVIRNEIAQRLLGSEWPGLSKVTLDCAPMPVAALAEDGFDQALAASFVNRAGAARDTPSTALAGVGADLALPEPGARATLNWAYSLVWDFELMALIRFRLTGRDLGGVRVHPYQQLDGERPEALLFEQDVRGLGRVVDDLSSLAASGRRLPVILPIHASSLSRASWANAFAHTMTETPKAVRGLLTLEICAPAASLRTHSVHAFVEAMGRIGVACTGCFYGEPITGPRITTPLKALNFELPDRVNSEAAAMRMMAGAAGAGLGAGTHLGVYGLGSRSLVVSASSSGFRFLAGDAIHADVATLDNAVRFDLGDFYREFMPRR
jgi:hypothetical protein